MRPLTAIPALMLLALPAAAAEPAKLAPTQRGKEMIRAYFRAETRQVADACLADVRTLEDWEKRRPELRRQFLEMMGLWPLPPRGDLKAEVTGRIDMADYTIEKVLFQSWPGLYVTGNLYVPKPAPEKAPTVLYVCGHARVEKDGVAFGNKVAYQHHPAWFARNGYVCFVIDTLQLGEIPGIHHGTYNHGMWWWQTLGYTPAGIECWNAMRALDYLETRPEVDPQRFGVTGRSGGGATSWWLAAADERPRCVIPVAGIADLWAHLVEGEAPRFADGVISGHCDCMYMVNTYRWDFAMVAALCAPRPLLLGNSDADAIFPVAGYRRLAEKARKVYELYGAGEKFDLLETEGPHKDTPELRLGAFRWMNRWLKGETGPVTEEKHDPLPPEELKVVERIPEGAVNATVHEVFRKPASFETPRSPEVARQWWDAKKSMLTQALREKVFRGWEDSPPDLNARRAGDRSVGDVRLRAYDFVSEEGIELRLWLVTAAGVEKPSLVVLNVLDEAGFAEWCRDLGPAFGELLQSPEPVAFDQQRFEQTRHLMARTGWGFAAVAPRGIGPTRWAEPGSREDVQIRRRFPLLGQTLDGQRVWDVRRALAVLRGLPGVKGTPLWLQGKNAMAGVALYAGLFEPDVARFDLWDMPASHREGPILLNVRTYLDAPQAVALAAPRPVKLYVRDKEGAKDWQWTLDLQKTLGEEHVQIRVAPK